ncbi:MAG: hypothetical protein IKB27_03325 [Clostridia bacterium]|nr:hypothetical protein [Clostridia bacterium]
MIEKTKLIPVILLVFVIFLSSCNFESNIEEKNTDYSGVVVVVEGVKIADENARIYDDCCRLSFVKVLSVLGAEINWKTSELACVKISNRQFELDLKSKTYQECGTTYNFLIPAPGTTTFFCESIEKDIVLDDITLRCALKWSGYSDYIITSNVENKLIMFNSRG